MASKSELQALIVLAGKVDPSLQKAIRGAEDSTKSLNRTTQLLGTVATSSFNILRNAALIGTTAVGAGLAYIAKMGIDLASDLNEVQNVVDVTFGESADQINQWALTTKRAYGLSELSTKKYTGTLGAMMKSTGVADEHLLTMSKNLTALAGDFSSFYNLNTDEAFDKIRSGISGETEPLKALGINMSVAAMEAYALAQGIETPFAKMSEADKTLLRYNYLLAQSADAQGDFGRTMDSWANQQRILKLNIQEVASKIMEKSLPALTKLGEKGNEMMEKFLSDPEKLEKIQNIIGEGADKLVEIIPEAITFLKDLGVGIYNVFEKGYKLYKLIDDNWSIIAPTIMGIVGAMIAWKSISIAMTTYNAIMAAVKAGTVAATWAQKMFTIEKWKDIAATLYLKALYAKDTVVKWANVAATWGMTAATSVWTAVTTVATAVGSAFGAVIAFITSPIGLIIIAIAAFVAAIIILYKNWDKVSAFLSDSWQMIKKGFANGVNYIVDKLNWLIEKMNLIPGVEIPLIPKMNSGAYVAASNVGPSGMQLEMFAKGGFANKPSIFGEAGPEAAIPLKRNPRSLNLLNRTARILGVGGHSGGNGGATFVYSPSYGGVVSEEQKSRDFDSFIDKCEEWWESKRRENL